MLVFYLFSWLFNTPLNITEEERKNQDSLLDRLPPVVSHNCHLTMLVFSFDLIMLMSSHSFSCIDMGHPLVILS